MKKLIILFALIFIFFSFNILAQDSESLNTAADDLEAQNLSQEKSFSQSAREELLGIASQFDSAADEDIDSLNFESGSFSITETALDNSQHLNLLSDLSFDADYSKNEAEKLETTADFKLEYSLNSRTLIRAGYSLLNEEWWDLQEDNLSTSAGKKEEDSAPVKATTEDNELKRVYQNELESSRSLGLAYKSSERVTLSADFIDNNEFSSYYDDNLDLSADSTVLGVEYSYPEGSVIRARYQVDEAEGAIQKITGVDLAFNNLATFSASYKLLNPKEIEDKLVKEQTAWDLGLGVNLNENYGVALGYELIEAQDKEKAEQKIKASFEINF